MMKVATLVLRDFEGPIYGDAIGVDYGAWVLYERKIPMLFACGDFDSVDENQRKILEKNIARLIKLPVHKDVTDFGYVLSLLDEYDRIYVYGALGGRKDHEYVNIRYLKEDSRLIFLMNRIVSVYIVQVVMNLEKKKSGIIFLCCLYQRVKSHWKGLNTP